jgi:hypothetical protein
MKKFTFNTDIDQCKKDLLYLTGGIENWKEKQYLYSAIISHLTGSPFFYTRYIAIKAYEQLTGNYPYILPG